MKTNVALIGFMGVGKTAVGEALAKKLNRKFVELDLLIEQKAGKSIPEIFQQDGEVAFRELEIEATREVAKEKHMVIACGGGVVLNKINIDRLREESRIVCLTASPRVILERVSGEPWGRPLLKVDNPSSAIQGLLRFREPFYEISADIKIDTSKLDIDSVTEQIIDRIKRDEGLNL